MLAVMARMTDEQYPVARRERKVEQQEAANAELRNRRAMQPAGQLDARNAALRCQKPGGGQELTPDLLLAGEASIATLHVLPLHHGTRDIFPCLFLSSQ